MKNILNIPRFTKREAVIYITTVILSAILLIVGNKSVTDKSTLFLGGYDDGACRAVVTRILKNDTAEKKIDGVVIGEDINVTFEAKVKNGEFKGKTVTACEVIQATDAAKLEVVEKGDRVLLAKFDEAETEKVCDFYLHDFDRTMPLIVLGVLFVILVLLFGRFKGINTLVSLLFTCIAIFAVFVPSVLSGHNIYLWSILTCVYIIVMTLIITDGSDRKTLAAVIGCTSGVIISGLLTVISTAFLKLTGISTEDTIYISQSFNIDLHALVFAGIILGSLGAVMDVSVSISSSLKEIHDQVEKPTFGGLFKSGITIGRDIMGTMANTLVLAYIGCELSATLLSVVYSSSLTTLLSREKIVEEILQALVGSIGLLLTIPLTAFVSSLLYMRPANDDEKYYVEKSLEPSLYEHIDDNNE